MSHTAEASASGGSPCKQRGFCMVGVVPPTASPDGAKLMFARPLCMVLPVDCSRGGLDSLDATPDLSCLPCMP